MTDAPPKVSTGIPGLDEILRGGLRPSRTYLLHGDSGTGKTTMAIHFLREGDRLGERTLYVSLLQSRVEMDDILASHEWDIGALNVKELPREVRLAASEGQSFFSPADVELTEVSDAVIRLIEEFQPQRFVLDSVSELATLVDSTHQLRRQLVRIKDAATELGATMLLTANEPHLERIPALHTIVHGVIQLVRDVPIFGEPTRRLQVTKLRGVAFREGMHDFRIRTGGVDVFPRLTDDRDVRASRFTQIASGNEALDALLGGGLESGTASLITGTTGAGKSTLIGLYASAAAARGERSTVFCFNERKQAFLQRAKGLGMSLGEHVRSGLVDLREISVGETSPGRLADSVRRVVEEDNARIVAIDSVTGYLHAFPGERELTVQLHELITYLTGRDVLALLVAGMHGLASSVATKIDASYMADTVVLMRHFEAIGSVRQCISVLKKRHGFHERSIRELSFGSGGIVVGPPLHEFSNVLSGAPTFLGAPDRLLDRSTGQDPHHGGKA